MKFVKPIVLVILFAIGISAINNPNEPSPAQIISNWYQGSTNDILKNLIEFGDEIMLGNNESVMTSYRQFREAYKQIEFLIAYLNPQDFTMNINGAPLKKMAIDTDGPEVLNPSGIQVIDELVSEDRIDKQAILAEVNKLISHFHRLHNASKHQTLYDRYIFEAIRTHVTYITTLSISGFDTPGTLLGLSDSKVALDNMQWCFQQYQKEIESKDAMLFKQSNQLFEDGKSALQPADFNTFDRFTFTRDVLNPLNAYLLKTQYALGIEFRSEVEFQPVPVNFKSPHVFSGNYLNDAYFKPFATNNENEVQELGRTLFFDPILSANNERACASCHAPEKAFSEDLSKSLAFDGKVELKRNAMTLANSVYAHDFFYDLRAGDLSMQFEHVVMNPGEFNTTYKEVREKINGCEEYVELFEKAFQLNGKSIRKDHINRALKTYVASLVAMNSPFDKMMRNEAEVSIDVKEGYNLFMGKASCGTCHFPPTFAGLRPPDYIDTESEVLGVPVNNDYDNAVLDDDSGRFNSGRPLDWMDHHKRSFKTVTVRNAELSGPYFHNGSAKTLEDVVDFYNRGGGLGLGLDVPNQTLPEDSLALTESEKKQLIRFLNSLTDISDLIGEPEHLPKCHEPSLTNRNIGGKY